jgi:tetratricopeptide (TPR) repeat protein
MKNKKQLISKLLSGGRLLFLLFLPLSLVVFSCITYSKRYAPQDVKDLIEQRVGSEKAGEIIIPFEVDEEVRSVSMEVTKGLYSDKEKIYAILYRILNKKEIDLQYDQYKTFTANDTYRRGRGNCLSFTNLLIGMARSVGIDAFYVEVTEVNEYDFADGLVVNQRHICAGIESPQKIELVDFLPNAKKYFNFRKIDDLEAIANYYNNIGYDFLKEGKFDEAINSFNTAIEIFPGFTWAYNNLGVSLSRKNDLEGAIRSYEIAILLDPSYEAPYGNIANLYFKLGQKEKAEELLNRLEFVKSRNPYHHISRGLVLKDHGNHEGAIKEMKKAISLDRKNVEARVEIAKLYIHSGETDRAKRHLKRALKFSPENPEIEKMLASLEKGN